MKCRGNSEILHKIFRDTARINLCFFDFHVLFRTISCCISKSPEHLISFLTVVGQSKVKLNAFTATVLEVGFFDGTCKVL